MLLENRKRCKYFKKFTLGYLAQIFTVYLNAGEQFQSLLAYTVFVLTNYTVFVLTITKQFLMDILQKS